MATAFQTNAFQQTPLAFQIVSGAITWKLAGVTRNQHGAPLAGVTVDVFDDVTEAFLGTAVSDSGGNYVVTLSSSGHNLFAVGYLAGSPDVSGTTLNTLVASSST